MASAMPTAGQRLSDVEIVPVKQVLPGFSPRFAGVDAAHVRLLSEADVELPPVIVHRPTMRLIDGAHRLGAAAARGQERIPVRFFDGDEKEAFILAVAANNAHGLPLTLAERSSAATRILHAHPEMSDRAVAEVAGISAATVRRLRTAGGGGPAGDEVRVGRDGRARPVNGADGRLRAAELLKRSPELSLRAVARQARVSLGTVRDVSRRLAGGVAVVPAGLRGAADEDGPPPAEPLPPDAEAGIEMRSGDDTAIATAPSDRRVTTTPTGGHPPVELLRSLANDPSLRLTEDGRLLLRLLISHQIPQKYGDRLVASVPAHAVASVSEVARWCARSWDEFADRLAARESRPAPRRIPVESRRTTIR